MFSLHAVQICPLGKEHDITAPCWPEVPRSGNGTKGDEVSFILWLDNFLPMGPKKGSRALISRERRPHGVENGNQF